MDEVTICPWYNLYIPCIYHVYILYISCIYMLILLVPVVFRVSWHSSWHWWDGHTRHPMLQFLPQKLNEWIANNYAEELNVPLRPDPTQPWTRAWSTAKLNRILQTCLVSDRKGNNIHTFQTVERNSQGKHALTCSHSLRRTGWGTSWPSSSHSMLSGRKWNINYSTQVQQPTEGRFWVRLCRWCRP